jgi:hypothetical protein
MRGALNFSAGKAFRLSETSPAEALTLFCRAFCCTVVMRFAVLLLAATLTVQPALAQPLDAGPSAGVKRARVSAVQEEWMLTAGAAIMIGVGLLVSGGSSSGPLATDNIASTPIPVSSGATSP